MANKLQQELDALMERNPGIILSIDDNHLRVITQIVHTSLQGLQEQYDEMMEDVQEKGIRVGAYPTIIKRTLELWKAALADLETPLNAYDEKVCG